MYPTVEATNTSTEESEVTSHTVDLPAGIVEDDLLVVFTRFSDAGSTTINTPSGWTRQTADVGTTAVFTKIASGLEGSTLTVTTTGARRSTHTALRITGYNTTTPLYIALNNTQTPTNYNNPPSLSTGQPEATPFLWVAFTSAWQTCGAVTPPANYSDTLVSTNTYTSGDTDEFCCMATAFRELQAETEDPGAFSGVPQRSHVSITIAINPAPVSDSGTNTFVVMEPVFFSNSSTTGAGGTNVFDSYTPLFFDNTSTATSDNWTRQSQSTSTWTKQEKS